MIFTKLFGVQVVEGTEVKPPELFGNEELAHRSYVEKVKEAFGVSYPEFCKRNGYGEDDFSAAQEFMDQEVDDDGDTRVYFWHALEVGTEEEEIKDVNEVIAAIKEVLGAYDGESLAKVASDILAKKITYAQDSYFRIGRAERHATDLLDDIEEVLMQASGKCVEERANEILSKNVEYLEDNLFKITERA